MIVTNDKEREALLEGGKRLAEVLRLLAKKCEAGVTTEELDDYAEELIRAGGDIPSFLGYKADSASRAFPATLCVSINDEVVHGIPNEHPRALKNGDIVSLDLGLTHDGIVVDAAITVPVGNIDKESLELMRTTEEALAAGIEAARPGNHIGDIGNAIQKVIEKHGFTVVKELGGHGVGNTIHEEPWVANYGRPGTGEELVEGMVLALEPIASAGKGALALAPDGWTLRTKDGSRASHHEHTILIQKDGARVITR